jgi:hypothetical protein
MHGAYTLHKPPQIPCPGSRGFPVKDQVQLRGFKLARIGKALRPRVTFGFDFHERDAIEANLHIVGAGCVNPLR